MDDELVIRPARAEDRPAMERICAHTWDEGDYIQEVWDEWLADEQGPLLVGELNGEVVSLNKVTLQPGGQVWLEGMRVDPAFRGRGIASRCLVHNLAWAREQGARAVRLATGSHNTVVHGMVKRAGMEWIGGYVLHGAEPLRGDPPPAAVLETGDKVEAWTFLEQSGTLAHFRGLYCRDWAWQELTRDGLAAMQAGGEVVAHRAGSGRLAAVATVHRHPGDDEIWIGLAGGEGPALTALLLAIRGTAAEAGVASVRIMLPRVPALEEALDAAGYDAMFEGEELWVFEIAAGSPTGTPRARMQQAASDEWQASRFAGIQKHRPQEGGIGAPEGGGEKKQAGDSRERGGAASLGGEERG